LIDGSVFDLVIVALISGSLLATKSRPAISATPGIGLEADSVVVRTVRSLPQRDYWNDSEMLRRNDDLCHRCAPM